MTDPQQIRAWIEEVRADGAGAVVASTQLKNAGHNVVPYLVEALEIERHQGGIRNLHTPLINLTHLLIDFDSPRSLPILLRILRLNILPLSELIPQFVHRQLTQLEAGATPDDIAILITTLREAQEQSQPVLAVTIAHTLIRMAERDPKIELRAALPLLQPNFSRPFALSRAHRQLKALLKGSDLPIPAQAETATGDDLPIPAESEDSSP